MRGRSRLDQGLAGAGWRAGPCGRTGGGGRDGGTCRGVSRSRPLILPFLRARDSDRRDSLFWSVRCPTLRPYFGAGFQADDMVAPLIAGASVGLARSLKSPLGFVSV